MIKSNGAAELVDLIRQIARKEMPEGLLIGEIKSEGNILVGDTLIEADDYSILQNKFTFDGTTIKIPSMTAQTITWTNAIKDGEEISEETHTFVFPPLAAGDLVLLWQNGDGDYVLIGKM